MNSRRRVVVVLGHSPRVIDASTGREIASLRYVENFGWRVLPLRSIGEPSRRWFRDPFSACVARGWVPSIGNTRLRRLGTARRGAACLGVAGLGNAGSAWHVRARSGNARHRRQP